jgi:integrase/recombinase XerC
VSTLAKSHAGSNRELVESYERYLIARGNAAPTIRAYLDGVNRLVEGLGAASVVELERDTIRQTLGQWYDKGLTANSIRLHVCALRSFFKFIRLTGLTKHDPMLLIGYRKLPTRLPVVLTVEQVERLIAAAQDPFERAVMEVLYSTGVRVSELVKLRLEDINRATRTIRVHKGKGGKDRVVLFGSYAEKVIREYQEWRPSTAGFLFEAPARKGVITRGKRSWFARLYVDRVQREISLGSVRDIPTLAEARKVFERLVAKIPGYQPVLARPYGARAIRELCQRLAHRAKLGRVHPHALRRAMASHMLQNGGNLRVVQDLLGHERLNTTMRYMWLDANHIKKVHEQFHPHEGGANAEKV